MNKEYFEKKNIHQDKTVKKIHKAITEKGIIWDSNIGQGLSLLDPLNSTNNLGSHTYNANKIKHFFGYLYYSFRYF